MKLFDEPFINSCKKGDSKTQKLLFEQLYAQMFRVCLRYISINADAEDCMMNGFMKVFQNIEKFKYENEQSLFFWARKIMVNEALMYLRKQHNFLLQLEENLPDSVIEPTVIQKINTEDLYQIIMLLPTGYRTVFNLFVVEGYEHKEIASMLGITESTSKTQLLKAKNKLKIRCINLMSVLLNTHD